jgi:hypothetical protein
MATITWPMVVELVRAQFSNKAEVGDPTGRTEVRDVEL